ncbi:MAG: hypothetical protein BWX98_01621 [Candidatus Aminicenantes bacterium ADurb.Bin147]|nr:MAG: hypothetical protein BWX98_01621 [Candidatus Aminicenantes bacterium ADurb.Bin147]
MTAGEMRYRNAILSSNPCPKCIEASEQEPMTIDEWKDSEYGLPGSAGRYCEDDCHCLMVPAGIEIPEPLFGQEQLRGEDPNIRKVIELGPKETSLREIIDAWHKAGRGTLPKEVHLMTYETAIAYLRRLMAEV